MTMKNCDHSYGEIDFTNDGVVFVDCYLCEKRVLLTDEEAEEFEAFEKSMCRKCKSDRAEVNDLCVFCERIYSLLEHIRTEEIW